MELSKEQKWWDGLPEEWQTEFLFNVGLEKGAVPSLSKIKQMLNIREFHFFLIVPKDGKPLLVLKSLRKVNKIPGVDTEKELAELKVLKKSIPNVRVMYQRKEVLSE